MNTYLKVLRKYAVFSGRASRKEYWVFYLFNFTFCAIAIILDNILGIANESLGYGPVYGVYALGLLIPVLAVTVRRLHDVGKSGWMIFIVFIPFVGAIWLIVLLASKGNPEKNKFGEEPEDLHIDYPVTDEIIFVYILWAFLMHALLGILERVITLSISPFSHQTVLIFFNVVAGSFPLALALVVKNKSKRILLVIFGVLILLYNIYIVVNNIL